MNFDQILSIENKYRSGVHVSLIYIDMAEDLNAGILLSQILYWHTGNKMASEWLVKKRTDWFDECRLTGKQFDRALKILKEKNIVEVKIKKSNFYNGNTVQHIKINRSIFEEEFSRVTETDKSDLPKGQFQNIQNVNSGIDERVKPSITEITSEITSENTTEKKENLPADAGFGKLKILSFKNEILLMFSAGNKELKRPDFYMNPKEGKSLDDLVKRFLKQEEPEEFAKKYIKSFFELINYGKTTFHRDMLFRPSMALNQWDNVLANFSSNEGVDELLKEFFEG
jgi:hypothetical protein